MMVLPSFVLLWSSSILFLRGGASCSVVLSMLFVPVACGSVARGLLWRFLNMSCCVPGLRFVPFCRLRAAVLAVVLGRQPAPVQGAPAPPFCSEACLEESSRHGGTAGRFKCARSHFVVHLGGATFIRACITRRALHCTPRGAPNYRPKSEIIA